MASFMPCSPTTYETYSPITSSVRWAIWSRGLALGTELALNGTVAHAFCHILYKALLFMGAGAVIYATGRRKFTELGGIASVMPVVLLLYMVGAVSISGFPLFNGFISKSIIISAASEAHLPLAELLLTLAGVGTFISTGLKFPYFTFFGPDRGLSPQPIKTNMYLAMGRQCSLLHGPRHFSRLAIPPSALFGVVSSLHGRPHRLLAAAPARHGHRLLLAPTETRRRTDGEYRYRLVLSQATRPGYQHDGHRGEPSRRHPGKRAARSPPFHPSLSAKSLFAVYATRPSATPVATADLASLSL